MDELDIEIVKILIKDARTPFSKIGKMLGVSKDSIKRRYERIQQRNPNLKSTVILDFKKIGFEAFVVYYVKTSSSADSQKIKTALLNCPRIGYFTEGLGDFDFVCAWYIVDHDDLFEVNNYLSQIEGIISLDVCSYAVMDNEFPFMSDRILYTIK